LCNIFVNEEKKLKMIRCYIVRVCLYVILVVTYKYWIFYFHLNNYIIFIIFKLNCLTLLKRLKTYSYTHFCLFNRLTKNKIKKFLLLFFFFFFFLGFLQTAMSKMRNLSLLLFFFESNYQTNYLKTQSIITTD